MLLVFMVCSLPLEAYAQSKAIQADKGLSTEVLSVMAQTEVYKVTSMEVVERYVVKNDNENVVFHEVVVMADGSTYDNVIELISENKQYDMITRATATKGTGDNTYRHKVYGRSSDVQYYAYSEFDFQIKYEWDSSAGTSAMTYAYCTSVTQGFSYMYDIGRSGKQAWAQYKDLSNSCNVKYTYTVDTSGNISTEFKNW